MGCTVARAVTLGVTTSQPRQDLWHPRCIGPGGASIWHCPVPCPWASPRRPTATPRRASIETTPTRNGQAVKGGVLEDTCPYTEGPGYGWPSFTRPIRTAQTTSCCLVLNPSFLCIPDMALRTVRALMLRISPISW